MRTLRDWMSDHPEEVPPGEPLAECARRLVQARVQHLLVVDSRRHLLGVIEDSAVFRHGRLEAGRFLPHRPGAEALAARDLLRPATLAGPDLPAPEALRLLLAAPSDLVAVVDPDRRPVGSFSEHDAMVQAAELLPKGPTAASLMTPSPYSVRSTDPLQAAWVIVQFHGFRHLLVIDDDHLVGLLSRRDLEEADAEHDPWTTVDDHLQPPVETVGPDAELATVADRMVRQRIGCMPVVADRRVLGLLTRTDLIQALVDHLPPRSRAMRADRG